MTNSVLAPHASETQASAAHLRSTIGTTLSRFSGWRKPGRRTPSVWASRTSRCFSPRLPPPRQLLRSQTTSWTQWRTTSFSFPPRSARSCRCMALQWLAQSVRRATTRRSGIFPTTRALPTSARLHRRSHRTMSSGQNHISRLLVFAVDRRTVQSDFLRCTQAAASPSGSIAVTTTTTSRRRHHRRSPSRHAPTRRPRRPFRRQQGAPIADKSSQVPGDRSMIVRHRRFFARLTMDARSTMDYF